MEKLCLTCRIEGLKSCPIKARMAELQKEVPKKITSDSDLETVERLLKKERGIHESARERGCYRHNDFTLRFPKYDLNLD